MYQSTLPIPITCKERLLSCSPEETYSSYPSYRPSTWCRVTPFKRSGQTARRVRFRSDTRHPTTTRKPQRRYSSLRGVRLPAWVPEMPAYATVRPTRVAHISTDRSEGVPKSGRSSCRALNLGHRCSLRLTGHPRYEIA